MNKHILTTVVVASIVLLQGCSMDAFLFNNLAVNEYNLSTAVIPAAQVEAVTLKSGTETIYGFYVKQPDTQRVEPHQVILYSHGNKYNVEEYWNRVELFYRAGFDVFIYDYRGYGMSTGKSSEQGLHEDATSALNYLRSRKDVDTTQIVDYGYSLGGVPTMYLAATQHKPKCVITEAIFASSEALVRTGTLLDVPGNYIMEGAFDNVGNARVRTSPLLMLHGTRDSFVPFEPHGKPIFEAAQQPKVLRLIEGADHTEVPSTLGEETYIEIIRTFIKGN
ncbi:MAG: alpha/beta hydrolase [Ignavibacteria bacterium]|jgi:fermentation-respiration switch protein FrsA (DUF1100 family)